MPLDIAFIEWLVGQTGLVGIAGLALWLYSRLAKEAMEREATWRGELAQIRQERSEERKVMLEVISRNTEVVGQAAEVMRRVEARLS